MSNDLQILRIKDREPLQQMDAIANDYLEIVSSCKNRFEVMAYTANAMGELRKLLTDDLVKQIKTLANTRLGYLTDEASRVKSGQKPYDLETHRTCIIQATLQGLQMIGNQVNVIAGNCYVTKEGISAIIRRDRRISDLRINVDVPVYERDGRAIVGYKATWKFSGHPDSTEGKMPVRLNRGMGDDAALGKADGKIKKRIYDIATGTSIPDGEVDDATFATTRNVTASDSEESSDTPDLRQVDDDIPMGDEGPKTSHVPPAEEEQDAEERPTPEGVDLYRSILTLCRDEEINPAQVVKYAIGHDMAKAGAKMIEDLSDESLEKIYRCWPTIAQFIRNQPKK